MAKLLFLAVGILANFILFASCECDDEPLKCDDNEVVDNCPGDCPSDYCPSCEYETQDCPKPNPCPKPACKCGFNKRRAANGSCIPTRSCPPFKCSRPNEEYNPCPPICPSDDCSQASPSGQCPLKGRIGIVLECKPKCRCIKGYWRLNQKCVPYKKCNKKCGPNEEFTSKKTCPPEICQSILARYKCDSEAKPVTDCFCKSGFLRNTKNSDRTTLKKSPCIPTSECPENQNSTQCHDGT